MSERRFPTAAPNGEVARVLLAFLATAGLFYVNIMPALVDGLIEALGFSNRDAGLVGSANVYGAAVGAFSAVFVVKRINWRVAAVVLLCCLIAIDLSSMLLKNAPALIGTRFVHGCVGGLLVGIGFAVMARTTEVDRTFGYLLTIQFGLGGLGLIYLPPLVPAFGTKALFLSLIAFSAVTLLMLPFLSDYPAKDERVVVSPALAPGQKRQGEDGREQRPSPLIRDWPLETVAPDQVQPGGLRLTCADSGATEALPPAAADPAPTAQVGGAALIAAQANCPFAAVARFRMGARPLEEPSFTLDAALAGTLVHELLQRVWQTEESR